jgi:hypothetical protein
MPDFVLTWLPVLMFVVTIVLIVALLVWVTRRSRRAR